MKRKISLIRLTITIIVSGIIISSFIVAYIAYTRNNEHTILQAYDHMSTIMDLVSQNIKSMIDEKTKLLSLLRDEISQKDKDTNISTLVNNLLEDFDTILHIDKDGNIVEYWSRKEKLERVNISYREYFKKTKESLKPYISDSFRDIVGNYGVALTVPIVKDNSFNGLIIGGLLVGTQKLNYLVSSASFHRTGTIKILDNKGVVLFSSDPTETGKILNEISLDDGYKSIRLKRIDGKDYIVGIITIPDTNWKVLATVEKEDILFHSYRNFRFMIGITILLLSIFLTLVLVPLRELTTSLSTLRKLALDYVLGDLPQRSPTSRFTEVDDILKSFQEMRNTIREREEKLKEEQAYLENLLMEMGEGVLVLDSGGKIKFVNRSLLEMTGYSEDDALKMNFLELFSSSERERISEALKDCLENDKSCKGRIKIVSKDGREIPVLASIRRVNIDKKLENYLIVFTDLTEIEKRERELENALEEIMVLNEELNKRSQQLEIALASLDMKLFETERAKEEAEKLAITDPLTGLYNRRYLEEKLSHELIRAKAYSRYLSIIMADIDYFKKINDTYGHKVGDEVLKGLALILKANIRGEDVVARYGGEEFVIVLPNVSKYDAYRIAERIRIEIEETSFKEIGVPEKITVSFGISSFPDDGEEAIDLLKKADQALYQAKSLGRNRVEVFMEPSESIHF